MSDHQVQISIEADEAARHRERCNQRVQILKAKEFPSSQDPTSQPRILQQEIFGEKNFEIFQLRKAIQCGNVDTFVDVLEQLSAEKKLPLSAIFDQVTATGDSLLHMAAYFKKAMIAELIGHHFPELLTRTNIEGDTPLHVAARSKSLVVMKIILSQYAAHKSTSSTENNKDEKITRMTNDSGLTALHVAVYNKHVEGVTLLFEADKCAAHYLNKSEYSPLFAAIMISSKEIVNILLEAPFPDDKPLPKYYGNSPLHAVIGTRNTDLLKEIVDKRLDLMYLRDQDGETPLHYAVSVGYVEAVRILLKESTLIALEWNTKGHFPIHLACKWGRVEVLEEFLKLENDSRVFYNRKGQSILHIAVNNGQISVVKYLLKKRELVEYFLNGKDKDGNTPLHLAAKNFFLHILFHLTQANDICLNVKNKEGFTARDIVLLNGKEHWTLEEKLSNEILRAAGAKLTRKAFDIYRKRRERGNIEWLKDKVNTLMLVAILIVTVTFAAGFTVPGGLYSSDDPNTHNRGIAVLSKRTMFKVFVVTNTVALYSSIFGSFTLLWPQLGDYDLASQSWDIALMMVGLALLAMNVAFMAAVSLVVSNVAGLANFIIIMGIISSSLIFSIGILGVRFPFKQSQTPGSQLINKLQLRIIMFILSLLHIYTRPVKRKVKKPHTQGSQQASTKEAAAA